MNRGFRLTRSTDFKRVRRLGKSYAHPLIVLIASPSEAPLPRFGIAAGRTVGGAVQRNRAKRLIRAALHPMVSRVTPGWDIVLLARQSMRDASYQETQVALQSLLERARLVKEKDGV